MALKRKLQHLGVAYPRLVRFIGVGMLIFIAWFILYYIIFAGNQAAIDGPLIRWQTEMSRLLLTGIGYQAETADLGNRFSSKLILEGRSSVLVGGECGALELIILFAGLLLAYGGSWKNFLWYVPLGSMLILLMNIGRIAALALINLHAPSMMEFNHKYTFVILVYSAIFLLWRFWIKKVSGLAPKNT